MITYGRVHSKKELHQILALQRKNLPMAISQLEREREGFVTVVHTFEMLEKMNDACPHLIAKSQGQVVGYALCMHPKFAEDIEVLRPMFKEINALFPKVVDYMAMGQICIEKKYRKKGIFRMLYRTMLDVLRPEYSTIITEVDSTNERSLQAHYAIGFKNLNVYRSGNREWQIVELS
ncbi:GNAT family N-acetyltransferase [Pareuzebyella sediminis]|uniref:GNAT family N-acetyltransferase n=1 Tax=Pareuzebyella sediminis TaxID=2607998 RepID=UPI0011EF6E5D|nr:GNAT family N-acetyltransferase [Pareuzebyella sediminis]